LSLIVGKEPVMDKTLKIIGTLIIVGILILGVLYLLNLSGIASNMNPGTSIGRLIKGMMDSVNGIGASISRMFSNFGR